LTNKKRINPNKKNTLVPKQVQLDFFSHNSLVSYYFKHCMSSKMTLMHKSSLRHQGFQCVATGLDWQHSNALLNTCTFSAMVMLDRRLNLLSSFQKHTICFQKKKELGQWVPSMGELNVLFQPLICNLSPLCSYYLLVFGVSSIIRQNVVLVLLCQHNKYKAGVV